MSNNRGVNIAVINSGISREYVKELNILGGTGYITNFEDHCVELNSSFYDEYGSGTKVINIINNYVTNPKYYVFKVIDQNGKTSSMALEMVLEYILELDIDIDIVNISFSVNDIYSERIGLLLKKICEAGKYVVVTYSDRYKSLLKYRNFITVSGELFSSEEDYSYHPNNEIKFVSSMIPTLSINQRNEAVFFGGNKKATAIATGIISRLLLQDQNEYLEDDLCNNSVNPIKHSNKCIEGAFRDFHDFLDFETNLNAARIVDRFCDYLGVDSDYLLTHRLNESKNYFNEIDVLKLIDIIEEVENVTVNLKSLSLKDCEWVYSLLEYVEFNLCI